MRVSESPEDFEENFKVAQLESVRHRSIIILNFADGVKRELSQYFQLLRLFYA